MSSSEGPAPEELPPQINDRVVRVAGAATVAVVIGVDGDYRRVRWPSGAVDRIYYRDPHITLQAEDVVV